MYLSGERLNLVLYIFFLVRGGKQFLRKSFVYIFFQNFALKLKKKQCHIFVKMNRLPDFCILCLNPVLFISEPPLPSIKSFWSDGSYDGDY